MYKIVKEINLPASAWGDKFCIMDSEDSDDKGITLTFDHGAYFNFYCSDVSKDQESTEDMMHAMRNAALKLEEDTEHYILGVIRAGAGTTSKCSIPSNGMYGLIVSIKMAMDGRNVQSEGRKMIMPYSVLKKMMMDNRFITGNIAMYGARLADGAIARAAGFDIYISNDLNNEIIAMTQGCVEFSYKITNIGAYKMEKGYDDVVKGLYLCGAKVVKPDCVFVYNIYEQNAF